MRIIFMGTPAFSVPVLHALVAAGHDIAAVYCQPPRRAGRGKKERPSEVQAAAENLGLPVRYPLNFKTDTARQDFAGLHADVAVVVAYGLILPQAILDAPKHGCLNIHASLLPRWRGAAPIHRAIMAGDNRSGVCIMQMQAGLDTGPVLLCDETPIEDSDTTAVLHDRLADMGARLIVDALTRLGDLRPVEQSADGVTYAQKIDKSEAHVDWSKSAEQVDRHIRALSPFPGAWTTISGERVKLLLSRVGVGQGPAGTVLDDSLTIACGTGVVHLLKLQRAGKAEMSPGEFRRGFKVPQGTVLGE